MSQPLQSYFVAGLDPTGFTQIDAAQLLTMIDGAVPSADKGMVIVTVAAAPTTEFPNGVPNVPDAVGTTQWQKCLWLSVYNTFVTAYIWNPNGATDPTFQNWITISQASIGAGSIQGYQIAVGTITAANISTVSSASITGSVVAAWMAQLNLAQTAYVTNGLVNNTSPVFGDLNGAGSTVTLPVIGAQAVTTGKIALQAVQGSATPGDSQILDNSLTSQQMKKNAALAVVPLTAGATGAIDLQQNITVPIKSISGLPTAANFNPSTVGVNVAAGDVLAVNYDSLGNLDGFCTNRRAIITLPDPDSGSADAGKVPLVVGAAYVLTKPNIGTFGKYVQQGFSSVVTSTAIAVTTADSAALNYNTANLQAITSVTLAATTANAYHLITVSGSMLVKASQYAWVYLYNATGATAPLAAISLANGTSVADAIFSFCLKFRVQNGNVVTPVTYYSLYGGFAASKVSSKGENTTMTVEEIV